MFCLFFFVFMIEFVMFFEYLCCSLFNCYL